MACPLATESNIFLLLFIWIIQMKLPMPGTANTANNKLRKK